MADEVGVAGPVGNIGEAVGGGGEAGGFAGALVGRRCCSSAGCSPALHWAWPSPAVRIPKPVFLMSLVLSYALVVVALILAWTSTETGSTQWLQMVQTLKDNLLLLFIEVAIGVATTILSL